MFTGEGSSHTGAEITENSGKPEMKSHLHILLVDHNLGCLLHVKSILTELLHEVTTAEGAGPAIEILENDDDQYDVVIAATDLPGINMSHFVKSVRRITDIPIMMMSPSKLDMYKDWNMVLAAMVEGVCYFYQKPVSAEELRYVCHHAYRARRDEYEAQQILNCNIRNENASVSSVTMGRGRGNDESRRPMQPNRLPGREASEYSFAGNPDVVPKKEEE